VINLPNPPWRERMAPLLEQLDETSRGRLLLSAIQSTVLATRPGDAARELGEWTVARADAFGPYEKKFVLMHATMSLGASSPIERVVDLARGAVDAAREGGTASELVETLSMLRLAHLGAGDLVRSDEIARSYEELARAVRIPRFLGGVEQRRAMRALLAGRFTEAEAHANQAYALQPIDEYFEGLAVQIFAICYEQGRFDEVRDVVAGWAATYDRPAWHIGYAALLAEAGEHDAAREAIAPVLSAGLPKVAPQDDLYFLCAAATATTVATIGDCEHAPALYEMLGPHASRVIVAASGALCWGSIHRVLGPLAALMGNVERATVHFETSMAVHERLGARPFLARDRLAYARMLRDSGGDPVRIASLERTGLELAHELGMRAVAQRYGTRD
jgi:tetratricopeptide (TPR) repeat protein